MAIPIADSFQLGSQLPIDKRQVKDTYTDLQAIPLSYRYIGLMSYVVNENKYYYLKDNLNDWVEFVGGSGNSDGNVDYEYTVGTGGVQAYQVVFLTSANAVMVADASNPTMANLIVGIALGTANEGDTIKVRNSGRISNSAWSSMVNSADVIYVGNSGNITNDVSTLTNGFYQKLGIMEDSDTLLLGIEDSVIIE